MMAEYPYKTRRELAHKIFWKRREDARRQQADWEQMAEECREQGFRPEYCIHGTYMWVDYDCACGYCEMGEPLWDDARDWADAKYDADRLLAETIKRAELYGQFKKLDPNGALGGQMFEWVFEPLKPWS